MNPYQHDRTVLDALPRAYEPSRCHLSDLMVATTLPCSVLEDVLRRLSGQELIIIDKCDADPFYPPEARYFGAKHVFAKVAA
jgi:hypothetical protein